MTTVEHSQRTHGSTYPTLRTVSRSGEITALLRRIQAGDRDAVAELTPLVYDDLKLIAKQQRSKWRGDDTMSVTVLVHDAYMRMIDRTQAEWFSSAHFFAVASRAMRQLLVSYARRRQALKRGGDAAKVTDHHLTDDDQIDLILSVDQALEQLSGFSEPQARIVEARFFAGLTENEIAASMGVSDRTVRREWTKARAWLRSTLDPEYVSRLEPDPA